MQLTWATVLTLLGMLSDSSVLTRPTDIPTRELARDPVVIAGLWAMLGRAQYGHSHMEEAAFVVAAPDGARSLVRWPATGLLDRARWRGVVPRNAIAIVHTHPNALPQPSTVDAQTAIDTGLPVYVITRTTIAKTSSGVTELVARGAWYKKNRNPVLAELKGGTPPRGSYGARAMP